MNCRIIVQSHRGQPSRIAELVGEFLRDHPGGPDTSRVAPRTSRVGPWRDTMDHDDLVDTRWGWLAADNDELRWQTDGEVAIATRVQELGPRAAASWAAEQSVVATTGEPLLLPRMPKVPVRVRTYRDDTGATIATRWLTKE